MLPFEAASSIRRFARAWFIALILFAVLFGLLSLLLDLPVVVAALVLGFLVLISIAQDVGVYGLLGIKWIRLDEEGIQFQQRLRAPVAVMWEDIVELAERGGWRLQTASGRRYRLRESGFDVGDWLTLSDHLHHFLGTASPNVLPGVMAAPQPQNEPSPLYHEDCQAPLAVYVSTNGLRFWAGIAVHFLLSIGLALIAVAAFLGQPEQHWTALFFPLSLSLFLGGALVYGLSRLVRRAVFLQDAVTVERYLGPSRSIPYAAVLDGTRMRLKTKVGSFRIGPRNADSFWQLLEARLEPAQLSGKLAERNLRSALGMLAGLVAFVPYMLIVVWLGRHGLDSDVLDLLKILAFPICFGIGYVFVRLFETFAPEPKPDHA
ncbi:MAG: hypothetical protein AAF809_04590 [Bacteroidota bacterium]